MVALTRVLKRQAGANVGPPGADSRSTGGQSGVGYKPGRAPRKARRRSPCTDVRSNKVRYNENETATTVATLTNATSAPLSGTVIATAISELDDSREIAARRWP